MEIEQQRVLKFMQAIGQPTPSSPRIPDDNTRILRGNLMLEEVQELITALGLTIVSKDGVEIDLEDCKLKDNGNVDLVEVADGIGDIKVIANGTAISFGIDMEDVDIAIFETNMAKCGPGSYIRADGKFMKPPDWKAPDIEGIINKQCGN